MKYLLLARATGNYLITRSPRRVLRWAAWTAVALLPGSFMVVPVIWIARQIQAALSKPPYRRRPI